MSNFEPIVGSMWKHESWEGLEIILEIVRIDGEYLDYRISDDGGLISNRISSFADGWIRVVNFEDELEQL